MAGVTCSIKGCNSTFYVVDENKLTKSNISFHRFPKDERLRKEWLNTIKMFNNQILNVSSSTRICGKHFDDHLRPVYFSKKTSPNSTQELEYLSDYEDDSKENLVYDENGNTNKFNRNESTKINFRYPGDIKTTKNLSTDSFQTAIHVLQNTIKSKNDTIRYLHKVNRELTKKVESLEYKLMMVHQVLDGLVKKKYLGSETVKMIKDMLNNPGIIEFLSESRRKQAPQILHELLHQSHFGKYSDEVKDFAISLSFYSRRAYTFVRHEFNNALPSLRTIARWHEKVDGSPGFSRSAIPVIKQKIKDAASKGKKLKFSLQMDGMHLRGKYTVNKNGNTDGKVDFGNVKVSSDSDGGTAKESLTFLINSVNDRWKMPVAYFLINRLDAKDQAFIVEEVLFFLESNNIDVLSLTCDGTKTNLKTLEKLGASLDLDDFRPYFFTLNGSKIYVILDICHMIKLIRNNFYGRKQLVDINGKKIHWNYLPTLNNVQRKEKLHLGNRVTNRHIRFQKSKMKVDLAVQLLSGSVAASLRYLSTDKSYKSKFKTVGATADFIEIINNLFDIFNSRRVGGKIYTQGLHPNNYEFLSNYMDYCAKYIKALQIKQPQQKLKIRFKKHAYIATSIPRKTKVRLNTPKTRKLYTNREFNEPGDSSEDDTESDVRHEMEFISLHSELENLNESDSEIEDPLTTQSDTDLDDENWEDMYDDEKELSSGFERAVYSSVRTGFLGFLVAIESFKGLYKEQVVEQKNLSYIFTYKFSQDHLETFFSSVRSRGGFNDNPSPSQFRDAYRKLIMKKGVSLHVTNGNCQGEEIICSDTFNDLDETTNTFCNILCDEPDQDSDQPYLSLLNYNLEFNEYQCNVLYYIAGYLKRLLMNKIHCTSCIKYLSDDEEGEIDCKFQAKLMNLKNWGGLSKANENLIKLCKLAESVYKKIDRFDAQDVKQYSMLCFRSIRNHYDCFQMPSCNVERINDHNYFFIKFIFDNFLKIRLNHDAKLDTLDVSKDYIRSQCKKLPQFKNQ